MQTMKHATIVVTLYVPCMSAFGYGFLCSSQLMFTSFFCHLFHSNAISLVRRCCCCWCVLCLAIRFLTLLLCAPFVIFAHISAILQPLARIHSFTHMFSFAWQTLYTHTYTERERTMFVPLVPALIAHCAHSLENWVQHDLFTIRKYVAWLQHSADMIIFLYFFPFVFIVISSFDMALAFARFFFRLKSAICACVLVCVFPVWWMLKLTSIQSSFKSIFYAGKQIDLSKWAEK